MECYTVLLVDDEEDIRGGISKKMDWAALGFSLVSEAENGREALELAEQHRPDVVLTDIQMPFMDGLELCRILTQRLPATKLVVFSGFDDFSYAKQAIGMNVFEYILKPINAAELSEVLEKLRHKLDEERAQQNDMERLRRRYEESLPMLRELFFTQLLDGRILAGEVVERAARYDLESDGLWLAAVLRIDCAKEESELLPLSVQGFFGEQLRVGESVCRSFFYGDSLALLLRITEERSLYPLIEELDRVCQLAKTYLGFSVTVGVGWVCDELYSLRHSAAGARSALDYRALVGTGRAIYIGDLEPGRQESLFFEEDDRRELSAAVKLGSVEDVREQVRRLEGRVWESGLPMSSCQLFFLSLFSCLLTLTRDGNLAPAEVFGEEFTLPQMTDFDSAERFGEWCLARCLCLYELLHSQRTDSTGRMMQEAKQYIREHYQESDLSVEVLCELLHLSPSYFSTLFRRESGMTFVNYLTEARMEKAVTLLLESEEKTYRIAELVGYQDPNYFSYVFKKQFGMSPTKYRGAAGT